MYQFMNQIQPSMSNIYTCTEYAHNKYQLLNLFQLINFQQHQKHMHKICTYYAQMNIEQTMNKINFKIHAFTQPKTIIC